MGWFSRLFRNRTDQSDVGVRFELITEYGNGFYMWNGDLYKSDIVRSCIRPKAKAVGKLVAKHIRESSDGTLKVNPEPYIRFLLEEPNPLMTGQMLQEKLATQLALNNNAFALIVRDEFGYASQIYPIPCTTVEAIYQNDRLYLKFTLRNGKMLVAPYSDIIHLRQDFNSNDIFGESPAEAITSLMEIVNTTDQGIVKAVRNSNVIRWLLKFKNVLRPEDIKKSVQEFVNNYLSIDSDTGGAAAADAKYDVEQVKPQSFVPDDKQLRYTLDRIYSFFNTNENIVQSKYTENEWISYYESEIEPIAVQMSNEFTRKIFTRRERSFGNRIIFEASNLQYASMQTKLALVQMVDRGAMTPNEWRRVFNMAPIEGGDNPIRRLDTATVAESNADTDEKGGETGNEGNGNDE